MFKSNTVGLKSTKKFKSWDISNDFQTKNYPGLGAKQIRILNQSIYNLQQQVFVALLLH